MMWIARLACRSPPRFSRFRVVFPEEAGSGATPHSRACQVLCVTIVVDLDVCGWFWGRSSGVDGVPVLDAVKIVPPVGGCILTAPARRRHGPGWRNGRGVSHRHILGSSRPGKAKLSAP